MVIKDEGILLNSQSSFLTDPTSYPVEETQRTNAGCYTDVKLTFRQRIHSYGSLTSLESVKTLEEDPFIFDLSSSSPFVKKKNIHHKTNAAMSKLEMQSLLSGDEKQSAEDNSITWPRRNASAAASVQNPLQPLQSLFRPRSNSFDSHIPDSMQHLFHDVDVNNHVDTFLSAIDQIEDEFDQQTYEDLIPLQIRMALENQILGWDHLYSVALGHILLPAAGYTFMYYVISLVGLHNPQCEEMTIKCMWHKIEHSHPKDYEPIFGMSWSVFRYLRILISLWSALNVYRTIRRRRKVWLHRQKAEYFKDDTAAYFDIIQADRNSLLGKIRGGVSRRRDNWRRRRIQTQISRAERRFEKRHETRRREFQNGSAEFEVDHHRRVQALSRRTNRSNDEDTSITSATSFYQGQTDNDSLTVDDTLLNYGDDSEDFLDTYQKYRRYAKEEHEKDEIDFTLFYGHTMPAFAMQSISRDQIRFGGMINNLAYAHGGFFGAAPFMLANPHWINILRTLMPEVYVEISRRIVNTPVPQLIHWAENNPVVAAYGTAHELEYCGKVPTLEWDVFLDPHRVQRVEVVLEARYTFLQEVAKTSKRIQAVLNQKKQERIYTDKMDAISMLMTQDQRKILHFYNAEIQKRVILLLEEMLIAHGNASQLALEQTGIMKQINFSRVKHTRRTLGGGIYAKHWIMTYTEALCMSTELDDTLFDDNSIDNNDVSVDVSVSQSSAQTTPNNGPMLHKGESEDMPLLNLDYMSTPSSGSKRDNNGRRDGNCVDRSPEERQRILETSKSYEDLALAAISNCSISECMRTLKRITQCDAPLGIILDVKSRHVPKRVWALVLDALRDMGARVEGIASFFAEDIRDISRYCTVPTKEIVFFHTAGDLQQACHNGFIHPGDSVFINAGSLFWNYPNILDKDLFVRLIGSSLSPWFDAEKVKHEYKFQPYARIKKTKKSKNQGDEEIKFLEGSSSTIQQYKEHFDLSIGLYVQEFAVDEKSIDLLVRYANMYDEVINLGFSWGGVNGVTVRGIQPGRFTSTDGLWNQRYCGARWNKDVYPGGIQ